jgi:four helix bundle protein
LRIYREVLILLPTEEKWNLNQQMRRSSLSVPANIAEGYGRYYYQDNIRFCYNTRGSLEETLSHLVIAYDMNYIPKSLFDSLGQDGESLTQLINGYIGYLKRSKKGQTEPGAGLSFMMKLHHMNMTQPSLTQTSNDLQFPNPDSHV